MEVLHPVYNVIVAMAVLHHKKFRKNIILRAKGLSVLFTFYQGKKAMRILLQQHLYSVQDYQLMMVHGRDQHLLLLYGVYNSKVCTGSRYMAPRKQNQQLLNS